MTAFAYPPTTTWKYSSTSTWRRPKYKSLIVKTRKATFSKKSISNLIPPLLMNQSKAIVKIRFVSSHTKHRPLHNNPENPWFVTMKNTNINLLKTRKKYLNACKVTKMKFMKGMCVMVVRFPQSLGHDTNVQFARISTTVQNVSPHFSMNTHSWK